jgi:predicted site-specific integrase-resolvase
MSNLLPLVLTPEQLSEFLGIDRADLCKAMRAGRIPGAYRAGTRWFIGRNNFLKSVTGATTMPKSLGR